MACDLYAAQPAVNLGTAGNFTILAKTGISTTGTTSIVGDIGVSPAAPTYITGFGLIMDSSNQFSTSSLVNGRVYAAGYSTPTPSKLTTAISDMQTAYTDAAGRTLPDHTELGAGNIGGLTLAPGLYKWGTDVIIPSDVTLSGNSTGVWIFQIAGTLDISSGKKVILSGGAQAKNIFWQVAGQTTLGTTSVFNGIILDQTAIVINTGATLNGRALAQTAVTLDSNSVTAASGTTTTTTTTSTTQTTTTLPTGTTSTTIPATTTTTLTNATTTTAAPETTTSTTSTTTTTLAGETCVMHGNTPPCGVVSLSEVFSAINAWSVGDMSIGDVIHMIYSWADPERYPAN
ncbi:MAG: ice-binding family protein [Candidatus Altiarchaeia archaeon]